jgi:phosphoserine phosphatase RsbU/P
MVEFEDWAKTPRRASRGRQRLAFSAKSSHGKDRVRELICPQPLSHARIVVNKQIPNYLRLVSDTGLQPPASKNEDLAALERVCQAFSEATGWRLEYAVGPVPGDKPNLMWSAPVDPGVGASPGHIRLLLPGEGSGAAKPAVPLERAALLADSVSGLWSELLITRCALWQREAELAAGIPVVVRDDDDEQAPSLGERLEAVLRGGAEAIGCQAAGLYLLDAGTTELKLRSSWGLPRRRLAEPARPLRPALADLEALLGHAVVLVEPALFAYWKVPEEGFPACVCVPVVSGSMPLGTLWAFCKDERQFSDVQTNILEVVAGRLAADLEREVLVDEAASARHQSQQIAAAERLQKEQLPRIAPRVEGWEIAARAYHAGQLGGTFYDWFALDDGSLSVLAGDVRQHGVEGALTASALRGAARAFALKRQAPRQFLRKANSILWTGSAGSDAAGLFHAIVANGASSIQYSAAGPVRVLAIGADAFTLLDGPSAALGLEEDVKLSARRRSLKAGELLLAYGTTFMGDADEAILAALDQRLALALEPRTNEPADELVDVLGEILQSYFSSEPADRVAVLLKRRAR